MVDFGACKCFHNHVFRFLGIRVLNVDKPEKSSYDSDKKPFPGLKFLV